MFDSILFYKKIINKKYIKNFLNKYKLKKKLYFSFNTQRFKCKY